MSKRLFITAAASAVLAACGGGGNDGGNAVAVPQLFAQTNDTDNAVVRFVRNADGTLSAKSRISTGGKGTNGVNYFMGDIVAPDALTSNNSIIVSADKTRIFVANAGDNTVSTFAVNKNTGDIELLAVSPTGGAGPASLAYHNGALYVTHQRGEQELGAYRVAQDGKLTAIGQYAVVQKDALPTQVEISPDGKFVVVNGFLASVSPLAPANTLLSFPILADGSLGAVVASPSVGVGPFGGRFGTGALSSTYVLTEAAGTTASSYSLAGTGSFSALSGPVTVSGQQAPCWLAITPDNRFVYVSNGGGSISLFLLDNAGKVSLSNPVAASEPPVSSTLSSFAGDSWISPDGKYLYQDYSGADKIVSYSIGPDGSLKKIGEQAVGTQSKVSLQGLVGI